MRGTEPVGEHGHEVRDAAGEDEELPTDTGGVGGIWDG